jgi:hypothetical protein
MTAFQQVSNASRPRLHVVHGFLNLMAWGFLLPLGIFLARFAKPPASADVRACMSLACHWHVTVCARAYECVHFSVHPWLPISLKIPPQPPWWVFPFKLMGQKVSVLSWVPPTGLCPCGAFFLSFLVFPPVDLCTLAGWLCLPPPVYRVRPSVGGLTCTGASRAWALPAASPPLSSRCAWLPTPGAPTFPVSTPNWACWSRLRACCSQ